MAPPRMLYEDGRPYTVPESLGELTGPTTGVVELPAHLDWSEQGRYDLSDPRQRNLMYEVVIRESMRVEDLRAFLHGPPSIPAGLRVVGHGDADTRDRNIAQM